MAGGDAGVLPVSLNDQNDPQDQLAYCSVSARQKIGRESSTQKLIWKLAYFKHSVSGSL